MGGGSDMIIDLVGSGGGGEIGGGGERSKTKKPRYRELRSILQEGNSGGL